MPADLARMPVDSSSTLDHGHFCGCFFDPRGRESNLALGDVVFDVIECFVEDFNTIAEVIVEVLDFKVASSKLMEKYVP